jgi:MATE family multidrug resistance protein
MGIAGVAYGTLFAQYSALLLATILMSIKFYNLYGLIDLKKSIKWQYIKGYFAMNGNLFARSLLMLVVYAGFTLFATKYGDVELAVSNLMMKLLLLYSYFTDGFAYAAEALTGKYIGAQKGKMLQMTIKWVFVWSIIIGIISTIIYAIWGAEMVKIFTDDPDVIKTSHKYLFWLIPMPLISCIAFTWDGIYIGATASAALRNCMVWSAALFVATLLIFKSIIEIQALYLAYFMHLFVRSVYQTIKYKHYVKIDKSRYPTEK